MVIERGRPRYFGAQKAILFVWLLLFARQGRAAVADFEGKGLGFGDHDYAWCGVLRYWGAHKRSAVVHPWKGKLASLPDKQTAAMLGSKAPARYAYVGLSVYDNMWLREDMVNNGYFGTKMDQYADCGWKPCGYYSSWCFADPTRASEEQCGFVLVQSTDLLTVSQWGSMLPAFLERKVQLVPVKLDGLDAKVFLKADRSRDDKGRLIDVCTNREPYEAYDDDEDVLNIRGKQKLYMAFSSTTNLPDGPGKIQSELVVQYRNRFNNLDSKICVGDICETIKSGTGSTGGMMIDFTNATDHTLLLQDLSGAIDGSATEVFGFTIKYICPPDSGVKLRDGTPLCECNDGLLSESGTKSVRITEKCNRRTGLTLAAAATWMEARIQNVEGFRGVSYFLIEAYMQGSATSRSTVYPGHGQKIHVSAEPSKLFSNLEPGKRYTVSLTAFDANDKEIPTEVDLSASQVTHCACSDQEFSTEDDITGAPEGFLVKQANGIVSFQFQAASRCEDAYAFTREEGTLDAEDAATRSKKAFTANFYYSPRTRCDMNPVETTSSAVDDLSISKLAVNSIHTYCVRAVASSSYMHDPYDDNKPAITSSNVSCAQHRVRWEASIAGKVVLEPSAGSLPVEGVEVNVQLKNVSGAKEVLLSDTTKTGAGGNFQIVINEELGDLKNQVEYAVHITFSKETRSGNTTIPHIFMCDQGMLNCTENGTIVYVKHLDFEKPVVIYDTTAVLFAGKVVVGDTADGDESGAGCPIQGAEVCLVEHGATSAVTGGSENGVCVLTGAFGEYALPAVIGRRVSVDIRYDEHEFSPIDRSRIPFYEKGILIEADGEYLNNDFEDTSKAHVFVEVAGGLCNKYLGTSHIEVAIAGGCKWRGELKQSSWRGVHLVPAHLLDLQVVDVTDSQSKRINVVQAYFKDKVNSIDLRELPDGKESNSTSQTSSQVSSTGKSLSKAENETLSKEEAKEENPEESIRKTRFQYDGTLWPKLILGGDRVGDCDVNDYIKENQHAGCDSLHVLRSASAVAVRLMLEYHILEGVTCDIVSEDLRVRLINSLGPDGDEKKKWTEYQNLNEDLKKSLDLCNEESGGCLAPISHDFNNVTEVKSNAQIKYSLLSGPPNINGQFYRTVEFLLGPEDNRIGNHRGCVVIEGDFSVREAASVPLPSHNPILVIRDPPGGLSTATYENVRSTLKADISSHSTFVGFASNVGASLGFGSKIEICAGGGFGVVVFACTEEALETDTNAEVAVDFDKDYLTSFAESSDSGTITTTWTYSTSDDPSTAGRMSDTFLVPNLNVKFREVATISWDVDKCSASSESSWKFDLESQSNKPTISFVTVYDLENSILPDFQNLIGSINETTADDAKMEEKKTLQRGLEAWTKNLAAYNETNEKAKQGKLAKEGEETPNKPFMVYDYFKRTDLSVKPDTPISSLIPLNLAANAISIDGGANGASDGLLQTNQIEFSGGGGLVQFSMHAAATTNFLAQVGSPSQNSAGSFRITTGLDTDISVFGIGGKVELAGDIHYNHEEEFKEETETESSTEISFVLGDGEQPDKFVVAVYLDPVYHTFIFTTVSGVSSCPTEEGTDKAADPKIKVNAPTKPVLPTDPMVFNIELTNAGALAYRFELFMDNGPNQGMLTALVNGFSLAEPQHYENINSRQTIYSTLSVLRGPNLFEYPALKIGMRLQGCNTDPWYSATTTELVYNQIGKGGEKQIVFAKPCQAIHWAGDLRDNRGFEINTESEKEIAVTVFNPNYMQFSLEDAVTSERLESVALLYREVGDLRWSKAKAFLKGIDSPIDIDFANSTLANEDNYGYATVSWAYSGRVAVEVARIGVPLHHLTMLILSISDSDSQVVDGNYELMVETQCIPIEGAPQSFNYFSDDVLYGVIDRKVPKQHGKPSSGPIIPGRDIVFAFSEALRCESFQLHVTVEDIKDGATGEPLVYNRDSLDTFCEKRTIGFAFDASKVDYGKLMGKRVQIKVTHIFDKAGNRGADISHEITMADVDLEDASASFLFTVKNVACASPPSADDESAVMSQVEQQLGVTLSANRLSVSGLLCDQHSGEIQAKVTIASSSSTGEGSNRLLRNTGQSTDPSAANSDSLTLAQALINRGRPGAPHDVRSLEEELIPADYVVSKLEILPDNPPEEPAVVETDGELLGRELERLLGHAKELQSLHEQLIQEHQSDMKRANSGRLACLAAGAIVVSMLGLLLAERYQSRASTK